MLTLSILMPIYKPGDWLHSVFDELIKVELVSCELVLVDDSCDPSYQPIIEANLARVPTHWSVIHKTNPKNLGYPENLQKCFMSSSGDLIFLLGQDDLVAPGSIADYVSFFDTHPGAGVISRFYYWFHGEPRNPVRAKKARFQSDQQWIQVNSASDVDLVIDLIDGLDQLSGLAFRRSIITGGFHKDIFPCHIYPFMEGFFSSDCYIYNRYSVAVRIESSQTRGVRSIYKKSPLQSWIQLVENKIEPQNEELAAQIIEQFVSRNYIGLLQIRIYGSYFWFWREVFLLIKYRPRNVVNIYFGIIVVMSALVPPPLLGRLIDFVKISLNSKLIDRAGIRRSFAG